VPSVVKACLASVATIAFAVEAHDLPRERIDVEGHYENGIGTSDAASSGTVTEKLIENRPVLRAGEVLEFVPGVVITQHSGDGKANQYYLRGFNLDHGTDFATWVAGMPVNMPSHAHGQGYSDLNFLIPELARRIDYFKGPYFAREGDFSSAGVARIELADHLRQSIANATLGENGYARGVLAASPEIGNGTLLAGLEVMRNDGPWVNPERLRKWSGMARYSRGGDGDGWSVTAMGYEAKWNATDQIPQRAVDNGTLDRFGAVNPTDGGDTARYSLSFDLTHADSTRVFQANAYAIRSRLDLFSDFTYFLDDPLNGDQFEQTERRTVLGGEMSYGLAHRLGAFESFDKVGVQVRNDRIDPVALYATVERERIATRRENRVDQASGALFWENSTHWTPWLRTLAGLRYDRYRFGVDGDGGGSLTTGLASPKLSAIVGRPFDKVEFFANWGRGFHSNDARALTPLVRSNGCEIGLRAEPAPGLQTSIALWQLAFDSELVFVGDAGTTEAGRPSRRHGIEWNTHYVAGPHWLVDLDVAASYARFTDDDPAGDRIPGALETVVSFGAALVDHGPWSASLHLRYFGPRPLVEDNSVRSKATTLVSGRVGYRLSPNWRIALDAFNLFDRKASDIDYFYASRLRGEPAAGIEDIHFHPVEPRTFRLSVSLKF
jgi:outer membrane receptor protein involved in Fe transport